MTEDEKDTAWPHIIVGKNSPGEKDEVRREGKEWVGGGSTSRRGKERELKKCSL